ncbi:MAG: hypothetical protein QG656_1399 [Candidatus Hydrogenedentes bacterium]|nr:hypothetical protein [Candidatus Hydrogenedentota bacterium]
MIRTVALLSLAMVFNVSSAFCDTGNTVASNEAELTSLSPKELAELVVKGTSIDGKEEDCAFMRGLDANTLLCEAHTPEADAELKNLLLTYGLERIIKQRILLSLGERGDRTCVDIISEFDSWTREVSASPPPFRVDIGSYGGNGQVYGERYIKRIGECVDADNQHWAVLFYPSFMDSGTLWLTRLLKEGEWTRPVLVSFPARRSAQSSTLSGGPDTFIVSMADGQTNNFALSEVTKDVDNDGSPDLLERFLGTNPSSPDSDDDGVLDGKDSNPLTPPNPAPNKNNAAIRQAAFTVAIATHWERMPIYVWARDYNGLLDEPQEFHGYGGPILWTTERVVRSPNVNGFDIEMKSLEEATVRMGVSYNMCSGQGDVYTVKKLHGRWVVTGICGMWVE